MMKKFFSKVKVPKMCSFYLYFPPLASGRTFELRDERMRINFLFFQPPIPSFFLRSHLLNFFKFAFFFLFRFMDRNVCSISEDAFQQPCTDARHCLPPLYPHIIKKYNWKCLRTLLLLTSQDKAKYFSPVNERSISQTTLTRAGVRPSPIIHILL